ncbi:hypothetical protein [Pseudomonas sp. NFR09]|uniref:hypothetical protein n=1 Tax=Pseudomonas sp. NFR09 TaxID=1566249 RepID=UPI00111395D9|nr:hypothetical protein [Pseudomonas sp. NFR09]
MLFQIPIEAAEENWVHIFLNDTLLSGFNKIDAKLQPEFWTDLAPADKIALIDKRTRTRDAICNVLDSYSNLASADRMLVRQALTDQGRLEDLFLGQHAAVSRDLLPVDIIPSLQEMGDAVFELLTNIGIRNRSYKIFFDKIPGKLCPFCGYESIDGPNLKVEDWDHYIPKSLYPFASANLKNLSPMGMSCNRSYKKAKDTLRSNGGLRRRCFNPFTDTPPVVHVKSSPLFARKYSLPDWQISIVGADPDACETWDSVFQLKNRWSEQLDGFHRTCISFFGRSTRKSADLSRQGIIKRLEELANGHREEMAAGSFLKFAIYELWLDRCSVIGGEGDRLIKVLTRAVEEFGLP